MIHKIASPDSNVERALQELYKKINEIINAVNQVSTREGSSSTTETIRRVKKNDGTYAVQFKVEDGWIESDNTEVTGFRLKDN